MGSKAAVGMRTKSDEKVVCFASLILFIIFSAVVSAAHEPWLDEAQGWLIARDASFHDMLFLLPHYEGHPPFWWLLLSLPAKLGAGYELSLSVIMLMTSTATAAIILFRSPFPLYIRILMPFSYYFFYQYGIIARPYGLYTLGFVLMAVTFRRRNEHPFAYILANMLVCASSAYGIVLCGGLAIAWCTELLQEYGKDIMKIVRNKRFYALLMLLVFALFEIYELIPYPDVFTIDNEPNTIGSVFKGIYYVLFMLPADSGVIGGGMGLTTLVKYNSFAANEYITLTIVSAAMLAFILYYAYTRGKMRFFLIPYLLMAGFSAVVYLMPHHRGIIFIFLLFIIWICADHEKVKGIEKLSAYEEKITKYSKAALTGILAFECLWSVTASVNDLKNNYFFGREAAQYLKDTGLYERNIMSQYYSLPDKYSGEIVASHRQHAAVTIAPYFGRNIFYTLNSGREAYFMNNFSDEINEKDFAEWRNTVPDVLVGEPDLHRVYGDDVKRSDYILVKTIGYTQTDKMMGAENFISIYLRKDLFSEYPDIRPQNEMDLEFIS